jgi:hypothetical protein
MKKVIFGQASTTFKSRKSRKSAAVAPTIAAQSPTASGTSNTTIHATRRSGSMATVPHLGESNPAPPNSSIASKSSVQLATVWSPEDEQIPCTKSPDNLVRREQEIDTAMKTNQALLEDKQIRIIHTHRSTIPPTNLMTMASTSSGCKQRDIASQTENATVPGLLPAISSAQDSSTIADLVPRDDQDLWKRAYDQLSSDKGNKDWNRLIEASILKSECTKKAFGLRVAEGVREKMKIMTNKQWVIKWFSTGKSIKIRDQVERIVQVVQALSSFISAAASQDPTHAGLAWAGVCVVLPVSNDWVILC